VWTDVGAQSAVEYDVTATAISGGTVVNTSYQFAGGAGSNQGGSESGLLGKTFLWDRQGTETGIVTLAAVRTTASSATVLGSINWEEVR